MKQEIKKASKVVNAVELSKAQVEYIDNAISYELQVIDMDNLYNKDRASLTRLLVENVALALTDKPTYDSWNYIHGLIREGVCKATGMEFDSFDKNIWKNITDRLESDYELSKPSSPKVKSQKRKEERKAIDSLTDDELKVQGKLVELARREEKRLNQKARDAKKDAKNYVKNFADKMKALATTEPELAMYIETNVNKFREDMKKQS
jgi:hypothetical protein